MQTQNIHNPERQTNETTEVYKARRLASNQAAKANSQTGSGGIATRKAFRDQLRFDGDMKNYAGSYGRGLVNWITRKQAAVLANKGL